MGHDDRGKGRGNDMMGVGRMVLYTDSLGQGLQLPDMGCNSTHTGWDGMGCVSMVKYCMGSNGMVCVLHGTVWVMV